MNKKSKTILKELHSGHAISCNKNEPVYYWVDTNKRVDANAVGYLLANGYADDLSGIIIISEYSKAVWSDMLNHELK